MSTAPSSSVARAGGNEISDFSASSFLDLASWHTSQQTDVVTAYGLSPYTTAETTLNVALILPRAHDPTFLLQSDWGTRQHRLEALGKDVFKTYGASHTAFHDLGQELASMGITTIGDPVGASGYVSSAESRTQWVTVNAAQFAQLFGTTLYEGDSAVNGGDTLFWIGDLTPASGLGVSSIWLDQSVSAVVDTFAKAPAQMSGGAQSPGNGASGNPTIYYPQQWAELYGFPLTGQAAVTGTLGLLEPNVGTALPRAPSPSITCSKPIFRPPAWTTPPPSMSRARTTSSSKLAGAVNAPWIWPLALPSIPTRRSAFMWARGPTWPPL